MRYDKLSTLSNAAGTGIDPGPRTCSGDGCEISFETLVNEGFLPVNYAGDNLQKSSYKILLKRDGTTPNYVINGLVATTAAWKDGSKIRYDLLGKAMMAAGIDSGMTKSATVASGYGGQWSEKSSDFKNIASEGLLEPIPLGLFHLPFWTWAVLEILTYYVYAPVSPRCPYPNWLRQ